MTRKEEFIQAYNTYKNSGVVMLHLKVFGDQEIIVNYNPEKKVAYVLEKYDDDLVMIGCKDIYIHLFSFMTNSCTFHDSKVYMRDEKPRGFDDAITMLKDGFKVSRRGWNGKNQYIQLAKNISYKLPDGEIVNPEHNEYGNKAIAFIGTTGVQLGWLASQADMLADDWYTFFTEEELKEIDMGIDKKAYSKQLEEKLEQKKKDVINMQANIEYMEELLKTIEN
jgi:hypothetical protein